MMAAPTAPCGICFYCQRGQENLCPQAMEKMVLGAYADYPSDPAHIVTRNAFKKPANLSFEEAALLEPLSCVVHAQEMARPETFESVLIVGAGRVRPAPYAGAQGPGRARGRRSRAAARIACDGPSELGADRVIDAARSDPAARGCVDSTAASARIWSSSAPASSTDGIDAFTRVRRGGRVVFFGGCPPGTALNVDTRRMHYDNLTLLAPFHFRPRDVDAHCDLLSGGALGAGRIINARRGLGELDRSICACWSRARCSNAP